MLKQPAHSYGVIPLHKDMGDWLVLLINQKDKQMTEYWTFPKGTPEVGELPLETARRETAEEVGIHFSSSKPKPTFTDSYTFEKDNVLIEKKVTYYLGFTASKSFIVQELEVLAADWFPLAKAKEKLAFASAKNILKQITVYLLSAKL